MNNETDCRDGFKSILAKERHPFMIDSPMILQSEQLHAATIRFTIPRNQIQIVMGPAMGEVLSTLKSQGLTASGPLFSHHFRMLPDIWDFEVGVPFVGTLTPAGRVQVSSLPSVKIARTTYRGDYGGLGAAWAELGKWITENGHTPAENLWEFYVSGPDTSSDPAQWETELNRPLTA